jgi:hypothetical protein
MSPIMFANQPAMANIGGSYGKLHRFDAKAS